MGGKRAQLPPRLSEVLLRHPADLLSGSGGGHVGAHVAPRVMGLGGGTRAGELKWSGHLGTEPGHAAVRDRADERRGAEKARQGWQEEMWGRVVPEGQAREMFTRMAVNKHGGLETQKWTLPRFRGLEIPNRGVPRVTLPLKA